MAEMVAFENSFGHMVYGIPLAAQMPPLNREVILFVEDASVAIHGKPVVGWNSGTDAAPRWWTGVPAKYIDLAEHRWAVTHWRPLHADRPDGVLVWDETRERAEFEAAMRKASRGEPDWKSATAMWAWEAWCIARKRPDGVKVGTIGHTVPTGGIGPATAALGVLACDTPDHCRTIQRCARVGSGKAARKCDTVPAGVDGRKP